MDELQSKILGYKPNTETKQLLSDTQILLLVGPTGSGKNTLENELLKTGKFKPIVTHTTRLPRVNHGVAEKDGQEYHFISEKQALSMLDSKKFVEAAFTHEHLYGTSLEEFAISTKEGKIAVADIDIKGVRSYRELSNNVIAVFILPPNFKALSQRLIYRYGKSNNQDDIKIRFGTALDELSEFLNSDYYYVIVNDDMDKTTKKVLDIVAGKVKLEPNPDAIESAQKLIDEIKDYLSKH